MNEIPTQKVLNPKNLENNSYYDWVAKAQKLVAEERKITLALIECLEMISTQMIYAELGYGSLFEFCTRHLGLSEGSAHRRISAMRLSRDVPTVKSKLVTGELSLSNAAKIEVATRKSKTEKSTVVEACLNLSQKECEVKLFTLVPETKESMRFTEHSRTLSSDYTEIKLLISTELKIKIDELQNLMSHQNPEKSILKLFEKLANEELERQQKKRSVHHTAKSNNAQAKIKNSDFAKSTNAQVEFKGTYSAAKPGTRTRIPAQIQKQVWTNANHQCQFEGCKSRYQLQIEHLIPVAFGGTHELSNLTLLCRTHNLFRAKQIFGSKKMGKYVKNLNSSLS